MGLESPAADTFRFIPGETRNKIWIHQGESFKGQTVDQLQDLLKNTNTDSWGPILFAGLIFGSIGMGAWIYGKKQTSALHMILGAVLIGYPYFTSNLIILYAVGIALTAALFVFRP